MKIDHIAIWVDDIEKMRKFYLTYFDVTCNPLYYNPVRKYSSYFLTFDGGSSRIELMNQENNIDECISKRGFTKGWAHLALTVGSKDKVNLITERFRKDGYTIQSEPRTTGDGYYESAILDPEGNLIELIA